MIGIQPSPDQSKNGAIHPAAKIEKSKIQSVNNKEIKISHLLEKERLTNRDMNKLSKLMAQEDYSRKPDSLKSLEIRDEMRVVIEKGASNRDTSYWALMRPIPLSQDETESFRQRDSILSVRKKTDRDTTAVVSHKRNYGVLNPLFFGIRRPLKDTTWSLKYDGLISTKMISFNAVDGWKIAQGIAISKIYKPGKSLILMPYIAYAKDRDKLLATGSISYSYAPLKRGTFELTGGKNTLDFNPASQVVHPFINSVASLFYKENFGRYYENRFLSLNNKIDIKNGLILTTGIKWSNIRQLQNSTNFSFLKKGDDFRKNRPTNLELTDQSIEDQINTVIGIKIEYTPKYYYRVINGVKKMSGSNYPTFFLAYRKGIKELFSGTADFDFFSAGLQYSKDWNSTSSIAAELHGGWFPNNARIHFSDFSHAQTQTSPILLREYRHSFFLPGYYSLSTSDKYMEAHLSVRSPYILLKYLPGLSNTLWREMVWCSYYTSPLNPNYAEVGYTLLEVLLSVNIGTHVGFENGKISNIGFNLAFRISY
jgi:hypothetical protein